MLPFFAVTNVSAALVLFAVSAVSVVLGLNRVWAGAVKERNTEKTHRTAEINLGTTDPTYDKNLENH
jgi:hypothetical protein